MNSTVPKQNIFHWKSLIIFLRSGLSSDYSFWRMPVNNVPKCYNGTKSPDIRFAQRCSDDLSTSCGVGDYCPNSSQNYSNCLHFFCSQSKTCIEHDKTCDGICHCQYCEDEYFEGLCQFTFPEAATIKCIESNRSIDINITIMISVKKTPQNEPILVLTE